MNVPSYDHWREIQNGEASVKEAFSEAKRVFSHSSYFERILFELEKQRRVCWHFCFQQRRLFKNASRTQVLGILHYQPLLIKNNNRRSASRAYARRIPYHLIYLKFSYPNVFMILFCLHSVDMWISRKLFFMSYLYGKNKVIKKSGYGRIYVKTS